MKSTKLYHVDPPSGCGFPERRHSTHGPVGTAPVSAKTKSPISPIAKSEHETAIRLGNPNQYHAPPLRGTPRQARASALLRHGCGLRPRASPPGSRGVRGRSAATWSFPDPPVAAFRSQSPIGPLPLRGVRRVTAAGGTEGRRSLPENLPRKGEEPRVLAAVFRAFGPQLGF
jgi:hypothetical protein